jgi:hypothetical protein
MALMIGVDREERRMRTKAAKKRMDSGVAGRNIVNEAIGIRGHQHEVVGVRRSNESCEIVMCGIHKVRKKRVIFASNLAIKTAVGSYVSITVEYVGAQVCLDVEKVA